MAHIPRIYHPEARGPGSLTIAGEAAKRLSAVMRLDRGSELLVFAGDGREWRATIETAGRSSLSARIEEMVRQDAPQPLVLETWIATIRAARLEDAIAKCIEAGADIIRPVVCEFSQRGEAVSPSRLERWQRIVIEAAEQSDRLLVPVLREPAPFEHALEGHAGALAFGDFAGRGPTDLAPLLPATGHLAFAVGPEGDFSERELTLLRQRGALGVWLGPHVLRTETAAIAGTALLRALTAARK